MNRQTWVLAAIVGAVLMGSLDVRAAGTPQAVADHASTAPPGAQSVSKYAVDQTPVEVLEADPAAKAVVEKYLPGLFKHPAYESFKASTLADLAPFSDGKINDDVLKSIQVELAQLK